MYYPSKEEFKKLAKNYNLVLVSREIVADIDTPVSVFQKLKTHDYAFLLESVEGGERLGRYSFLGASPHIIVEANDGKVVIRKNGEEEERATDDPLTVIEELLSGYKIAPVEGLPPFAGGAVGFMGYDAVRYFEEIPKAAIDDLGIPQMIFIFTDTILIFDHLKHKIKVVANVHLADGRACVDGDLDEKYDEATAKIEELIKDLKKPLTHQPLAEAKPAPGELKSNISKEQFLKDVEKAKDYIKAGDVLQVVLSQRFEKEIKTDPFNVYRVLRTLNPSPYMYYLKYKELELIGSSPEPLVKVQGDDVITRPIAGTRRRGKDEAEEKKFQEELLASDKEKAEHIMLVDLGRNDLGRVCADGSVKIDEMMYIEKYSHVMHIVSQVSGKLRKDKTAFDVLKAAFPAGTVSGAPKIRAMEIIDEIEPNLRGPYAGIVGYFSYTGSLDTCITIRTVVVRGGKAYVQAGAGIVYDSIPEEEYKETLNKARALLGAIDAAEEEGD